MEAVDIRPTLILWIKNFFFVIVDKEKKNGEDKSGIVPAMEKLSSGRNSRRWRGCQKKKWRNGIGNFNIGRLFEI